MLRKIIQKQMPYIITLGFYVLLFAVLTKGIASIYYVGMILLAFSPECELFWRKISGVRPLRLHKEKSRLISLYYEVYRCAIAKDGTLSRKINLYIKEDMSINAFAFGKSTLVITRGAFELMNDECLKGLIAHEFGHFSAGDTSASLFMYICNLPISVIVTKLGNYRDNYDKDRQNGVFVGAIKGLVDLVYYIFRGLQGLGDLILMATSRKVELRADKFAHDCGFGKELAEALLEIYSVSVSKPRSVKEQLNASHPDITIRIERLETGGHFTEEY